MTTFNLFEYLREQYTRKRQPMLASKGGSLSERRKNRKWRREHQREDQYMAGQLRIWNQAKISRVPVHTIAISKPQDGQQWCTVQKGSPRRSRRKKPRRLHVSKFDAYIEALSKQYVFLGESETMLVAELF